ncbi:MAG: exodeoxyribonuclease VII small subunit [Bacteroidetes bacterium]|nr:exodeoxyribonuclease VII small subunit [Bacteroidota bacterium]
MKKELNYSEAFSKLEELVEQLEDGNIQLDKLTEKVKQANELIAICESKLRDIDNDLKEAAKSANTKIKKGKAK